MHIDRAFVPACLDARYYDITRFFRLELLLGCFIRSGHFDNLTYLLCWSFFFSAGEARVMDFFSDGV